MPLEYLDLEAFKATPLTLEPFNYLVVPHFLSDAACAAINKDYPKIASTGSYPVGQLTFGPNFQKFLDELASDEFRQAFEAKFGVDLAGRPHTITARGRCSPKDGKIHTDTKSKILTILIYMNPEWEHSGGRLRLLRSNKSLDDPIMEVPPSAGTLLAFKRSDNSWHGHESFDGERRVIQFNWVTSEGDRRIAMLRHNVSAAFKRFFRPGAPQPTPDY